MTLAFRILASTISFGLIAATIPALSAEKPKADRAMLQNQVLPIFEANCIDCHGEDAPSYKTYLSAPEKFKKEKLGPRMTNYDEVMLFVLGPETGSMAKRLDDGTHTLTKRRGNMYKYLGESDREREDNLKILKLWIGEKSWQHSAGQTTPTP